MDFWFSEMHTNNVKMSIRVEKQLFSGSSDFQRIDVFESEEFGRFLTSDGSVIFSEKDEFTYDEMIVHVPMAVHPHVKKVLVIGGGDGGVARELSYYSEIEAIDVVIDIIWMPVYSYHAAAWGHLASYLTMLFLTAAMGRRYYPVPYDWPLITVIILLGLGTWWLSTLLPEMGPWVTRAVHAFMTVLYVASLFAIFVFKKKHYRYESQDSQPF